MHLSYSRTESKVLLSFVILACLNFASHELISCAWLLGGGHFLEGTHKGRPAVL